MSPLADRERLAHFIQLIGAEPREAEFDELGKLSKIRVYPAGTRWVPCTDTFLLTGC
jgi:hypothetical protein